ncbi:autotransporter domain-containing protein [Methylobacterium sp. NEAU 140]|uniref:autotransporter domain-containing protein n=1 Tax=Methylobacterium sp. NEAU 140 TaxID=3064945 RepID=UPI002736B5BC|nr:autotransporter domain-containing protein [Methylobacterium sp. NEAU 140]MDP4021382.1 autotransporter domain-containing protein [Methylobacterium sp. NEAU 140]
MQSGPERRRSFGRVLRCGTALAAVFAASAAHAQCADPTGSGVGGNFSAIGLPTSSTVSGVQSLVSILTTQNTAFLTQTSGFIGAPGNPAADLQGGGVWARGIGGTFDTRTPGSFSANPSIFSNNANGRCNTRTFQDYAGFQAGADISRLNINGFNIHGGVTMGYTESSVRSNGTFRADFQTPFVGLYGAITKGSFFADGQIRWDFFQGNLNDPTNTLTNQRLDARSLSLTGNVGYQIPLTDGWFVEPSAGAVYAEVKVDALQTGGPIFVANNPSFALPANVKIRDFDSILGRASVRLGRNFIVDGYALQPFFTASVISEFGGPVRTDIATAFGSVGTAVYGSGIGSIFSLFDSRARLNTYRIGTYGQFSLGLAGQILNTGWLGYVRGDYRTGDRVDGWGISGGVRYQFTPETVARALITKGESPVLAALDGPVVWSGFSVGGSVGALWSQTRQRQSTVFINTFDTANPHAAGVYAGGQVGADYQFGNIVVGVAGDAGWTNARGGRGCAADGGGYIYSCRTSVDDIYMATGRVGYAFERTLVYAKGGAVFADTTDGQQNNFNRQSLFLLPNQFPNSLVRAFETGWTVGAGFEFALTKNWSAKAEYMHYELDRKRYANFGSVANQAFVTTQNTGDIVKIGVNYRFIFEPAIVAPAPRPVIAKY